MVLQYLTGGGIGWYHAVESGCRLVIYIQEKVAKACIAEKNKRFIGTMISPYSLRGGVFFFLGFSGYQDVVRLRACVSSSL